jgi:hypothetical protein
MEQMSPLSRRRLLRALAATGAAALRRPRGHTAAAPPMNVMNSRRLMLDLPPPESVYRRLSLPQRGRRVLWEDLNCSEWRHGKRIADRAGKLAERKPSWWAGLSSNRYRGRVGTSGVASDTEMLII